MDLDCETCEMDVKNGLISSVKTSSEPEDPVNMNNCDAFQDNTEMLVKIVGAVTSHSNVKDGTTLSKCSYDSDNTSDADMNIDKVHRSNSQASPPTYIARFLNRIEKEPEDYQKQLWKFLSHVVEVVIPCSSDDLGNSQKSLQDKNSPSDISCLDPSIVDLKVVNTSVEEPNGILENISAEQVVKSLESTIGRKRLRKMLLRKLFALQARLGLCSVDCFPLLDSSIVASKFAACPVASFDFDDFCAKIFPKDSDTSSNVLYY